MDTEFGILDMVAAQRKKNAEAKVEREERGRETKRLDAESTATFTDTILQWRDETGAALSEDQAIDLAKRCARTSMLETVKYVMDLMIRSAKKVEEKTP